jgi:SAM-dependent methyltransferase
MTCCRRRSASGRTPAGAARSWTRWRRATASACSTWRPAPAWSRPSCSRARAAAGWWASIRAPRCWPAHARARFAGVERVELIEGQAEQLPFADASFDALTFTYLLRYVDDLAATMRELARVVRPGGRVASLEFGVPPWAPARAAWRLYTRVGLPTLGRLCSREWAEVGRFLGPSITGFYASHPLERIVAYWHEAGLEHVEVGRMSFGGGVVMSATKAATMSTAANVFDAPAGSDADET